MSKLLCHWFVSLDSFRFLRIHFTTHQLFVANTSAISPFLGGYVYTQNIHNKSVNLQTDGFNLNLTSYPYVTHIYVGFVCMCIYTHTHKMYIDPSYLWVLMDEYTYIYSYLEGVGLNHCKGHNCLFSCPAVTAHLSPHNDTHIQVHNCNGLCISELQIGLLCYW